jgi:hypothetical protein
MGDDTGKWTASLCGESLVRMLLQARLPHEPGAVGDAESEGERGAKGTGGKDG